MVISVQNDKNVSLLCKYVNYISFSRQDTRWLSNIIEKKLYNEISQGFSCFWFYFQVLIHAISTLTFKTISQASLPYQDAVIIIFKIAFKKAAMISCIKQI